MTSRLLLVATASLLAGTAAEAVTFTRYTNRAAFTTAASAVAVQTFNGATPGTRIGAGLDFGSFTVAETQFGSFGGGSQIQPGTSSNAIDGTTFLQASLYDSPGRYGSYLTFTFDQPITAFGGNFSSGSVNRVFLDVLGQQVDRGAGSNSGDFFGFVSDTPFTSIVMRSRLSNHVAQLDNLTYSVSAADVPEPASWAMMVGGFGLLGGMLRANRRRLSFA